MRFSGKRWQVIVILMAMLGAQVSLHASPPRKSPSSVGSSPFHSEIFQRPSLRGGTRSSHERLARLPGSGKDMRPRLTVRGGNADALDVRGCSNFLSEDDELWQGGVVSWGLNYQGRLGNGDAVDRFRPARSLMWRHAVQVSAGDHHSLGLINGGKVFAWGCNGHGQLGDDTTVDRIAPVQVSRLDRGVVKVAAGGLHSLALLDSGSLVSWGDNRSAQLGQPAFPLYEDEEYLRDRGYPSEVYVPNAVMHLTMGVIDMAAGFLHSLALLYDGSVLGWGQNMCGQLGNGKNFSFGEEDEAEVGEDIDEAEDRYMCETAPNRVRLPPGVQGRIEQLSCGGWHSCALLDDGALLTWGNNHFGQLGNGTFTGSSGNTEFEEIWNDRLEPGYSTFWTNITQVSAGHYHNLAILANGSVVAWGSNQAGQLGLPDDAPHMQMHADSEIPFSARPLIVQGLPRPAISVSAGFATSLAVLDDSSVWAWGANFDGQLGDGWISKHSNKTGKIGGDFRPRQVKGLGPGSGVFDVSAGSSHMLASIAEECLDKFPEVVERSDGEKDWAWQMEQNQNFSIYDNTTENILRPAGPEAAFEGARPVVDEDGFPDFDHVPEHLPSFEVIRNESDVPGVPPTTSVRWRNVTKEEAESARMAWPQQYRDGYGTTFPPPEMLQGLLDDVRAAALRIGHDRIYAGGQGLKEYDAAIEHLLVEFSNKYHLRAAGHSLEDVERFVMEKNFNAAAHSARKAKVSFLKAQDRRTEEMEALQCRIRDEHQKWKIEEELLEIKEIEELNPLGERYDPSTMSWYLPDFRTLPIDHEKIEDAKYGHMILDIPLDFKIRDLRERLQHMLQDESPPRLWYRGHQLLDSNDTFVYQWYAQEELERQIQDNCETLGNPDVLEIQSQGWETFHGAPESRGVMRFESVDPAFGGDGGENVVCVRGYNFPQGKTWQIHFGEEGDLTCDGEKAEVIRPAEWHSSKTLCCWAPHHVEGKVALRIFCDGEKVWECSDAYEFVEPINNAQVVLRVTLRHASVGLNVTEKEIFHLHMQTAIQAREYVRKFGWFNTTQESYEAVSILDDMFVRLLKMDPSRFETLHNYGIFLKDIKRDEDTAREMFKRGGMEMRLNLRRNMTEEEEEELNEERELLGLLPESVQPYAVFAPEKLRWSDDEEYINENIPAGRYGYVGHICSDPDCEIPRTADPEEDSKAPYLNVVQPQLRQWDDAGYGRPLRSNQSNP